MRELKHICPECRDWVPEGELPCLMCGREPEDVERQPEESDDSEEWNVPFKTAA